MLNIFHKLRHVCIVVSDIQKAMAYYESVGIGPWYSWAVSLNLQNWMLKMWKLKMRRYTCAQT